MSAVNGGRALRWYAAMLRLLPREFRALYGAELERDFAVLLQRGPAWRVLLQGVSDVFVQCLREWWRGRGGAAGGSRLWGTPRGRRPRPGEVIMQWWNEFRLAGRTLATRPGFTLAAVLTLALGIGANVAIFAVVDSVLLQPLPYPASERIVLIEHHAPGINLPEMESSPGTTVMYQDWARSFSAVALTDRDRLNVTGVDRPAQVAAVMVTPSFFDVVRVEPARGRRFLDSDVVDGRPQAVILTHAMWQARFGGQDVLGQSVRVDGNTAEIVGVMPREFHYPDDETELLVPMLADRNAPFGTFGMEGIARLAPGVSVAAAQREVSALQERIPEAGGPPASFLKSSQWSASVTMLRDARVKDVRTALLVVLATVAFVLLIACANVANLFLVRAEGRLREISIRAALGATRRRLAWSYLSESLWLGIAGGVVGTAVATVAVRALVVAGPEQLPRLHEVGIGGRTLLFAALVSVVAGIVFGMLPLPRLMQGTMETLREGRGGTLTKERHRLRSLLIGSQVALALVLLVGSGLMLRSFQRLRAVDPGLATENVLTLGISLGRQDDRLQAASFYQQAIDEVGALPGVVSVSATNAVPLRPSGLNGGSFAIESKPRQEDDLPPVTMFSVAAPGMFETLRIPVLQGRTIERRDNERGAATAWVNEQFVRENFADREPLGQRIRLGGDADTTWLTIVGVVGDVRTFGLGEDVRAMVYLPLSTQLPFANLDVLYLLVRTQGAPMTVLPSVRAAVARLNGDVPLTQASTMAELAAESMAETSFTMTVLGIAAVVALLLGAIGLYGVITYVVAQRTREMGVRIALGAAPGKVRLMVVRQGMVIVVLGLAGGLAAALALTRLMQGLLFGGITPRDPVTFGAVTAVLVLVSVAALYLPARRASNVNPMNALRAE